MNDPGLDKPIERHAKVVQDQSDHKESDDAGEEQAYLEPSRWWFASTALPLIAGTFGPMANAFNICAISSSWRTNIASSQPQNAGSDVPDPVWLLAINGVSLAFALVANLALLFNMARRIPFPIAQPITIIGWYTSGFILIGLAASVNAPNMQLSISGNIVLTQAYYYGCLAAGMYILVASFMVITVIGAYRGHYSKDFQLTLSQRTLMLQTIAYMVYLLAGGAIFARIEGWLFLDGVWWANFTLLTIGIGDFSPSTHTGQSLLFPYAIGGIVILGLVIGSIRSLVLERGEKKIAARIVGKKREKVIDHLDDKHGGSQVRLGLFSHHRLHIKDDNEEEYRRRAEEFKLMRKIQDYADTRKKWTSLLISALSWLFLWLIGAAAFYAADRNVQDVDYFKMIYFAYTSLLTIGYGDYTIQSNAGKPIFVFWSLLAIPTLTILISNMGDTIVKGIRDLTIWFGELTILPGEGSTKQKLSKGAKVLTTSKTTEQNKSVPIEEPPGGIFLPRGDGRGHTGNISELEQGPTAVAIDRLGKEYEAEELEAATEARQKGDKLSADVHLYHYLLVKEIRTTMKDLNTSPSKKYSYHEWAWFMRLLGEDENDPRFHQKATTTTTTANLEKDDQNNSHNSSNSNKDEIESSPWSWMGINSPLLGTDEEGEWILERLVAKLEEELRLESQRRQQQQRQGNGNGKRQSEIVKERLPAGEGLREGQCIPVGEDG